MQRCGNRAKVRAFRERAARCGTAVSSAQPSSRRRPSRRGSIYIGGRTARVDLHLASTPASRSPGDARRPRDPRRRRGGGRSGHVLRGAPRATSDGSQPTATGASRERARCRDRDRLDVVIASLDSAARSAARQARESRPADARWRSRPARARVDAAPRPPTARTDGIGRRDGCTSGLDQAVAIRRARSARLVDTAGRPRHVDRTTATRVVAGRLRCFRPESARVMAHQPRSRRVTTRVRSTLRGRVADCFRGVTQSCRPDDGPERCRQLAATPASPRPRAQR